MKQKVTTCFSGEVNLSVLSKDVIAGKAKACAEKSNEYNDKYQGLLIDTVKKVVDAVSADSQKTWEGCRDSVRKCGKPECPKPATVSCTGFAPGARACCFSDGQSTPFCETIPQNAGGGRQANCGMRGGIGEVNWSSSCTATADVVSGSLHADGFGHCGDGHTPGGGNTGGSGEVTAVWTLRVSVPKDAKVTPVLGTSTTKFANACSAAVDSSAAKRISSGGSEVALDPIGPGDHDIRVACDKFGAGCLGAPNGTRRNFNDDITFTVRLR